MANIKSAKKRILVNRTKAERNKSIKSSVSKIGLKTFTEAKRIPVGLNPTKICSTTEGNVYVLAMGNYNDISAKVQKIDNMNIVTDVTEATLMTVKDNTLYLINAPYGATENTYFSIDTKTGNETKNLIDQPVDSPCGIAVNPLNFLFHFLFLYLY